MSMSTHVVGFKAPDDKWKQMKAIWDSCTAAGVEPPEEVTDYFEGEEPDPAGVEVELDLTEWKDDYREGYEVKVADLPEDLESIRFYNSY